MSTAIAAMNPPIAISTETREQIAEYLHAVHGGRRSKYFLSTDDVLRLAAEIEARLSHIAGGQEAAVGTVARYDKAGLEDGGRTVKVTGITLIKAKSGWAISGAKLTNAWPGRLAYWYITRPGSTKPNYVVPGSSKIEDSLAMGVLAD